MSKIYHTKPSFSLENSLSLVFETSPVQIFKIALKTNLKYIYIGFWMMKQNSASNGSENGSANQRKLLISYESATSQTSLDLSKFGNSFRLAAEFYFQHAKRLYLDNLALARKANELVKEKAAIVNEMKAYEALAASKNQNESGGQNEKKRRKRRAASEIQRLYQCKADSCGKSYGSQGTLSQHYKLKHPEIYVEQFGDAQEKAQLHSKEGDNNKDDSHGDSGASRSEPHNT